MSTILSAFVSLLSFRFRSRAGLELELVALRHQVAVLRRQRKGRLRLFATDRLLWVRLYRIWPQTLNAMVLVKPATIIQWHRKGFRLYWRWTSRRLGRPKMDRLAGCRKNGVEHRRRDHADRRFADATPEVVGRHDHRLDLRHLDEMHDLVRVEVEIDHAPLLDRHFAVERCDETKGYRALDLGLVLVGVDRMAAVERQHHAMNLELALRAHRDLGGGGRIAVVAHELRDAAMHARRQRLAPVALLGSGIEAREPSYLLIQGQPQAGDGFRGS